MPESSIPWPSPAAPARKPNVVLVVLDDVGFAQFGCYGSDIATPNIDRLAAGGLRYNRFHVTALCSPTRAALLTGRNHHAVGMGFVPDLPMRLPGYTGRISASAATLARVLRDGGYSTMAFGKWHLTPRFDRTASGPFGEWPLGKGFERFYGFLHADTNQWTPNLVCDNHYVEPPRSPEDGYHLTEDLADTAIRQIADQQHATPHKPFFVYFATGAQHAPHQAPKEWIEPYRGKFDDGWEKWRERVIDRQRELGVIPEDATTTPRPDWVQDWEALPAEERALYARMQEVFAGFLSHTDHQIGRIVTFLEERGLLDDTVFVVMSDNGASAEGSSIGSVNEGRFAYGLDDLDDNLAQIDEWGGFRLYNNYAWGWAWAGNTPFHLWKRYAWLGGTRVPLVVHWPNGIDARGEVRDQFCHVVDLAPTLLDVCGITAPEVVDGVAQRPVDGATMRATFDDPDAAAPRRMQYFEVLGSRSIYADGWKATTNRIVRGIAEEQTKLNGSREIADDQWRLFDLEHDFAEAHDVAAEHPGRLAEMQDLWWAEAGRNQVLPMGNWMDITGPDVIAAFDLPPFPMGGRKVFRPGASPIADEAVPNLGFGGVVEADIVVPEGGGEGVLGAQGNWTGGWALVVLDGRPVFLVSSFGTPHSVSSGAALPPGRHTVAVRFARATDGGGTITLSVDGEEAATGVVPPGTMLNGQADGAALRLGHDAGFPVSDDYRPPFAWTGTLHHLAVEAHLPGMRDVETEIADAVHRD